MTMLFGVWKRLRVPALTKSASEEQVVPGRQMMGLTRLGPEGRSMAA
jgi:hypothetical protein